ncbi:MAG: Na+/H+ antiporter NhaA [Kofleriaceae bacterium]
MHHSKHAPPTPPETWAPAHRAARAIALPVQAILRVEAAGGLILLATTALALIWANSAWSGSYEALWHTEIGFSIGEHAFSRPLHFWINDGLMTIFFFVVGLEIRREIYEGELAGLRRAALPLAAALGGMLFPAAIFAVLNAGRTTAGGWAIPMATDIAFAVGVLTLLGSRVPSSARVLLLSLAVIDDIGAIIVIAVFYSAGLSWTGFAIAAAGLAAVLALRSAAVRSPLLYVAPGFAVWIGLYLAGIHPTLAGVLVGLVTPVRPWFGPSGFAATTQAHLDELDANDLPLLDRLREIERARREAVSPAERLIYVLHPWVAYVVMPLFALANAGVPLGGADLSGDALWLFLGIALGLAAGKPLGVLAFSLGASRLGIAERSGGMTVKNIGLVGLVAGIGCTRSLFIAQLAFPPGPMLDTAKLSILVGSAIAIVVGLGFGALGFGRRAAMPGAPDEDPPPCDPDR